MTTINNIKEHPVMRQVLADSFGGVLYDVANRGKYNTAEVLELWDGMTAAEQENADGAIRGAIHFLQGVN